MENTIKTRAPGSILNNNRPYNPPNYAKLRMSREQAELLERIALDVFTTMVNHGHTFQSALASVYLTGLTDATELRNE